MPIENYLDRLRFDRVDSPSLSSLARLQSAHMEQIPFENLNIPLGIPIEIDNPSLYQKIVSRKRGGFCYELNGLFSWLLEQLGFSVACLSARVYNLDKETFGAEFDHMTLLIELDRQYLVDVGFGDGFSRPIPIPEEGEEVSGKYRLQALSERPGHYLLERKYRDGWVPEYRFSTHTQPRGAYQARCHYHQTSNQSSFTQRLVCTRATAQGRLTLTGNSLTNTSAGEKQKVPIPTPQAFLAELESKFRIDLARSTRLPEREVMARLEPFILAGRDQNP